MSDTTQPPADVRERVTEPTQALIDDACMWYRHDGRNHRLVLPKQKGSR